MTIFIINGHGGAGKDSFIKYFTEKVGINYVLNISTVDYVKKIATQLGWQSQKDDPLPHGYQPARSGRFQ